MNILNYHISEKGLYPPSSTAQNYNNRALKAPNSTSKTSVFYVNDIHGQIPKMQRIVTAADKAKITAEKEGADFLKFSSGDTFIGSDDKRNAVAASFLNIADFDAETLGNHEFDITASICNDLLKNTKTKILGTNLNFPQTSTPLADKVLRSTVIEGKDGTKYGLIGIQPTDLHTRMKKKEGLSGITVDDNEETIKEIEREVKKLKDQNINRIMLISHGGNEFEQEIAKRVDDIDVIFGGHSHDLIEGVNQGINLLTSPSGSPVVITQAGRDGNYYGILNLEFDDEGHITYVQNSVNETNNHSPSMIMSKETDNILGVSPEVGELKYADPIPKNNLIEENAWADFVSDALRTELDADISLINAANFRGSVDTGKITERDIQSIFPFNNKLFKVKLNEKDLVDAIKKCAESMKTGNHKPGILQVSGLLYTIDTNGNLLDLVYTDKNNQQHNIDINNPDANKVYTAIYDEFLVNGGDGLDMLKRDDNTIIEKYDFDKDKITVDYIKKLNKPFEVKKDNRIKIAG